MRVLIVSHFFAPEPAAAANRVGALATALAGRGHDVTVLTGMPSFPGGVIQPDYRGKRAHVETIGGIRVERVWTYASDRLVGGNRLANWLSVTLGVTAKLLAPGRRAELVIVSSPPITLALPAVVARYVRRFPVIFDVRDVWPEMAIAIGRWKKDTVLARSVGAVADFAYRAARMVVVVTPAARREVLARGVPPDKVVLAPNGYDAIVPSQAPEVVRRPGETVVAFVGNIGLANGFDVVLDAAAHLRDRPDIRIVVVGDGADAARMRARAAADNLSGVTFLGVLPRDRAQRVLMDADACVVPLVATLTDSVPSKMFDALAVGCPVVLSANGEARRLLDESGGGIGVPAGDGEALAHAIVAIAAADPAERARMAAAGTAFVRGRYERGRIMAALAALVTDPSDPLAQTLHAPSSAAISAASLP